MLPCENSLAGRVSDIHSSAAGVRPVHHRRAVPAGRALPARRQGRHDRGPQARPLAHRRAWARCGRILADLRLQPVVEADTAGAAQLVAAVGAQGGCRDRLRRSRRRFMAWMCCERTSKTPRITPRGSTSWRRGRPRSIRRRRNLMTTFVFRVRNVPAALYKALGGFATNGVNMTKLESYMIDGEFTATQFLCDVEGHPEQPALRRALDELSFFSTEVAGARRLPDGSVPAGPGRRQLSGFKLTLAPRQEALDHGRQRRNARRLVQAVLNRPAKLNAVDHADAASTAGRDRRSRGRSSLPGGGADRGRPRLLRRPGTRPRRSCPDRTAHPICKRWPIAIIMRSCGASERPGCRSSAR